MIEFGGYPWRFLLAVGGTEEQTARALSLFDVPKHSCASACIPEDTPLALADDMCDGQVVTLKCSRCVLSLPGTALNASSIGDVAHECLHVVARYFGRAGIGFHDSSEEAWAYALGDIVTKVVAVLGAHRRDGSPIKKRKR